MLRPSMSLFEDMRSKISSLSSYDGGDTGFLNAFFPHWYRETADSRLGFGDNALRTMYWMTSKKPGYWAAVSPLRCIHFCSFPKPWQGPPKGELERRWWVAYAKCQLHLRISSPDPASLFALPASQPNAAGARSSAESPPAASAASAVAASNAP